MYEVDDATVQLSLTEEQLETGTVRNVIAWGSAMEHVENTAFLLKRDCLQSYESRSEMEAQPVEMLFRQALMHSQGRGIDSEGNPKYSDEPSNILLLTDEIKKKPKATRTEAEHGLMTERTKLFRWSLYGWGKMMIVIWGPKTITMPKAPSKTPTKTPTKPADALVILDESPVVLDEDLDITEVSQPSYDVEDDVAIAVCIYLYIQCPHHLSMYLSVSVLLTGTVFGEWVPRSHPAYNRRRP